MKVLVRNETGILSRVIVCSPSNFFLHEPINDTQAYFFEHNPPMVEKLVSNHTHFVKILNDNRVEVLEVPNTSDSPFQTFTRDVGFVIGSQLFLSRHIKQIRQKEQGVLKEFLREQDIPYVELNSGCIEGGDVFLSHGTVYVGIGQRTSINALKSLNEILESEYNLVPLYLAKGILHLDTVFSIIDNDKALLYKEGLRPESAKLVMKRLEVYEINEHQAYQLAANILFLSPELVIVPKSYKQIIKTLEAHNIKNIEIDFDEMAKLGGGPRCSCLPLVRN